MHSFPKSFLQFIAQDNSIFVRQKSITFMSSGQFQFNVQKSDLINVNVFLPVEHPYFLGMDRGDINLSTD